MRTLDELMQEVFSDRDLMPEQVPALDLYMDQVLTLLEEGLADTRRHPDEKLITKTMINNYSKEKLLSALKGKKYSHQHIMQILCIYQLKQMLSLTDVKQLTGRDDVDFEACWRSYLEQKQQLRVEIPADLARMHPDLQDPAERLVFCLALSAASSYMRRLCEKILDETASQPL